MASLQEPITVYVCNGTPIIVEGVRGVLSGRVNFSFAGDAAALADALPQISAISPRVVLIDVCFGWKELDRFLAEVKFRSAQTQAVLWVDDNSESDCFRALQIGAKGILRKTCSVSALVECLQVVSTGRVWFEDPVSAAKTAYNVGPALRFTPREQEIIACVCQGLRNREIAAELGITPGTVKVHLMHIFEKSGVKDRFELALRGRKFVAGMERDGDDPRL